MILCFYDLDAFMQPGSSSFSMFSQSLAEISKTLIRKNINILKLTMAWILRLQFLGEEYL